MRGKRNCKRFQETADQLAFQNSVAINIYYTGNYDY